MRILFITPDYPPIVRTGIATYVHSMARALVRAGETVHVLTYETEGGAPDSVDEGVHVHRRRIRYIPGVRRVLECLPDEWAKEHLPQQAMTRPGRRLGLGFTSLVEAAQLGAEFDVVEVPDYFCPGWAIAAARRWPVLTVLHSPLDIEFRYSNLPNRTYLRAARGTERAAATLSAGISSPTRIIRDELLDMGWRTVARATHNPIGIELATHSGEAVNPQSSRILIAGHITPRKGHDILARAVGHLTRSGRRVEVLCVGSYGLGYWGGRPFREHLERELLRAGCPWTFVNHTDRRSLQELYGTAEVVVVPSRFESFSMVALEGLAAGKPVVVSDRCGVAEQIPQEPEGGGIWVTPTDDDESLAMALDHVLGLVHQDRDAIGTAARSLAASFGNVDALVPDRLALYRRLA